MSESDSHFFPSGFIPFSELNVKPVSHFGIQYLLKRCTYDSLVCPRCQKVFLFPRATLIAESQPLLTSQRALLPQWHLAGWTRPPVGGLVDLVDGPTNCHFWQEAINKRAKHTPSPEDFIWDSLSC